jgi:multiple sugar transport system substrate-binding protein
MRKFGILVVGLVLVGGLVAAQEQVTLTVVHPWAGAEEALFTPVLAAAEEALGIKIETSVIRSDDLITLLPMQWAANTAPGDVIFLTVPPLIRRGAEDDHILEVTDLINPVDFIPGAVDPLIVEGEIYAAPYTQKPKPGFWYRKSFFEAHDLAEPTNWPEFVALLETIAGIEGIEAPIASGDGVGWPLSDVAEHFLAAFGGPQLHKELTAGTIAWTDPVVKAIFEARLIPLLEAGYFGEPIEWTTVLTEWWEGDYALYFMGLWLAGMVEDPDDLGLFPLPGTMGVTSSIDYLFVSAYTAYPAEAKALLKWLVTEGQKVQVQQGGHIATYRPVPIELYPPAEKAVAEAIAPMVPLGDLDDAIGGEFQLAFWDQLKLIWVRPERLPEALEILEEKAP